MFQRIFDLHTLHLLSRPSAERSAGRCQENLVDLISRLTVQTLENRAVLAVHRQNADMLLLCQRHNDMPAVTRVSLFASAISFPAFIAAIVGRIPIIPTTAVTTILRPQLRCHCEKSIHAALDTDIQIAHTVFQFFCFFLVPDRRDLRRKLPDLFLQKINIASSRQSRYFYIFIRPDHFQCLCSDRSG